MIVTASLSLPTPFGIECFEEKKPVCFEEKKPVLEFIYTLAIGSSVLLIILGVTLLAYVALDSGFWVLQLTLYLLAAFLLGTVVEASAQSPRRIDVNVSSRDRIVHHTGPLSIPDQVVPYGFPFHHGGISRTERNPDPHPPYDPRAACYYVENRLIYERESGACLLTYVNQPAAALAERWQAAREESQP
jgi:hypothetical protein